MQKHVVLKSGRTMMIQWLWRVPNFAMSYGDVRLALPFQKRVIRLKNSARLDKLICNIVTGASLKEKKSKQNLKSKGF